MQFTLQITFICVSFVYNNNNYLFLHWINAVKNLHASLVDIKLILKNLTTNSKMTLDEDRLIQIC